MHNQRLTVWLDCDPGHDDMLAIILAALNPQINLIGISTSAGNSTITNTTTNTLNILKQINKEDIPVYKGSPRPLCTELSSAEDIHGQSGLQGAQLKKSTKQAITKNVFIQIYHKIVSQDQSVHFVVTGAMTNLAILIKAFPQILQKIESITIMGGAIGLGNWSPSAEFNIITDPEAAQIVFTCGKKITMVPLQVTHTVLIDTQIFKELEELNTQFSQKLFHLFKFFQKQYKYWQNFDYPVAHDPCTIYYLLHKDKFKGREAYVDIQLYGKSRGRTNCQFMHLTKPPNSFVCQSINVGHFWKVMMASIRRIV